MKFPRPVLIVLATVLAGCVSAPPKKATEPVRKERTETFKVPVLLKESSFFADGVLDREIAYSYDSDLRLLLERTVREPSRAEPTERAVYGYTDGFLTSVSVFDYEGKLKTRTEYANRPDGKVIRETISNEKGVPQASYRYEYDSAGFRVRRGVYDGEGALLAVSEYAYSSGRLSVVIMKDSAGLPAGRVEHEYDADGLLLTRTTFDPSGEISRRERFAYAGGILTEEKTERGDGRVERRTVYEIGPEGAPIKSTLYDGAGRVRDIRTYENAFREEKRVVVYFE